MFRKDYLSNNFFYDFHSRLKIILRFLKGNALLGMYSHLRSISVPERFPRCSRRASRNCQCVIRQTSVVYAVATANGTLHGVRDMLPVNRMLGTFLIAHEQIKDIKTVGESATRKPITLVNLIRVAVPTKFHKFADWKCSSKYLRIPNFDSTLIAGYEGMRGMGGPTCNRRISEY